MDARQRKRERPDVVSVPADRGLDAAVRRRARIHRPPGPGGLETVVDDSGMPGRQGREHRLDARMVPADDQRPAGANPRGERGEGRAHGRLIGEEVGVLPLDVGDHSKRGVEVRERPAVLIGLQDEQRSGSDQGVATELRDLGADHRGRVDPGGPQHQGEHGRRGGLAVRASDREQVVAGGQLRQPVAAAADRNTAPPRSRQLGMVIGERAGHHDDVHAGQFRGQHGRVGDGSDPYPGAGGAQSVQAGCVLGVAAADHPATGQVDVGERGQARPGYSEEANVLRVLTGHDRQ